MNKLFTKVASICLGLAMAVGVGVAVSSSRKEAAPVFAAATESSAATGTLTFTAASGPTMNQSGTIPTGASASFSTVGGTLNSGCIQLAGKSSTAKLTITLTDFEGYAITGLSFTGKSNKSSGAGTLSLVAGTTTLRSFSESAFNSSNWGGSSYSQSVVSRTISLTNNSYKIAKDEDVILTIEDTVNSLYFETISFSWEHKVPTIEYSSGVTSANLTVVNGSTNSTTFTASNFDSLSASIFSNNPTNLNSTKASLAYSVLGTTVTVTATGKAVGAESFTISATGCTGTLTLNVTVQASTTFDSLVLTTTPTARTFNEDAAFAVTGLVVTANYTVGGSPATTVFSEANSNLDQLVYKLDDTTEIEIGDPLTVTGNHTIVVYYTDTTTSTTKKTNSYSITINAYVPNTYTKVTTAPADYRGTYLIVFEGGTSYTNSVALNPKASNINAASNFVSVTISTNTITGSKSLDQCVFQVIRDSDGVYRITFGSGESMKYLAAGSGSIALNSSKTDNAKISFANTDEVWFNEANYLRFNEGWPGFRGYGSGKQSAVALYKMDYSSSSTELTTFVSSFASKTGSVCKTDDTTNVSTLNSNWHTLAGEFANLSADAQGVLACTTYTVEHETVGSLKDIVNRYDYIFDKYGDDLTDGEFMNRAEANTLGSFANVINFKGFNSDNVPVTIIIVVSVASLIAVSGFFLMKRKEHR